MNRFVLDKCCCVCASAGGGGFTIGMSAAYLSLGAKLFPKGKPIVDRFHVERRVAHFVTKECVAALRKDARALGNKKYAQELNDFMSAILKGSLQSNAIGSKDGLLVTLIRAACTGRDQK